MITLALVHRLDRNLVIRARRETVFGYFTDSARWASWWGAGSTIDAHPGGQMLIRHPNGVEASGQVLEVRAPERIVFTYGYVNRKPSPGSSLVTIRLDRHPEGTLLQLTHEFGESDLEARDEHVQGWRFQLALFANLIADGPMGARPRSSTSGSLPGTKKTPRFASARLPRSPLRECDSRTSTPALKAPTRSIVT
jgi:uncharacterized protein YndB with AHSA1/START domain